MKRNTNTHTAKPPEPESEASVKNTNWLIAVTMELESHETVTARGTMKRWAAVPQSTSL